MTRDPNSSESTLLAGLFAVALGAGIILVSANIIPVDHSDFEAPRWIAALAGIVFLLGGLKVSIMDPRFDYFRDTKIFAIAEYFIIGLMLTSFAIIPTWIAFGPGERQFEGGISIPFLSVWFGPNANLGRIAFGFSSIVMIVFSIVYWGKGFVDLAKMFRQ